jgi:conjugal transfer pilin signal peptidase TrbI
MRRLFLPAFISFQVICVCIAAFVYINITPSLPYTIFIANYFSKELTKGAYCAVKRGVIAPEKLLKQIMGVPGDILEVKEDKVFINDKFIAQLVKKSSRSGTVYHAISSQIIPNDKYFLFASHKESYDSRYEEFGLVDIKNIEREVWPIY